MIKPPRAGRRLAKKLLGRAQPGPHEGAGRFTPPPPPPVPEADAESNQVWGFADTRFSVAPSGNVILEGERYDLSGTELPNLLPWIRETMQLPIPVEEQHPYEYPPKVPLPNATRSFSRRSKVCLMRTLGPKTRWCVCATVMGTPKKRCTRSNTAS